MRNGLQALYILIHLHERLLCNALSPQQLEPGEERRDGRTQLVCRLLREAYPKAVLSTALCPYGGDNHNADKEDENNALQPREERQTLQCRAIRIVEILVPLRA